MKKNLELSFLILYLFFMVFYYFFKGPFLMYLAGLFGVILLLKTFWKKNVKLNLAKIIILLIYLIIFASIFFRFLVYNSFEGINYIFWGLAHVGGALVILESPIKVEKVSKLVFWISAFFLGFRLWVYPNPNLVLEFYSRNHISIIMIFLSCLIIITSRKEISINNLIYLFISLIISILAKGRAGIISTGFLLSAWTFFYSIKLIRKNKKFIPYLFLFFVFFMALILIFYPLINEILYLTGFAERGSILDDVRFDIIKGYIGEIDFKSFLFGLNPEQREIFPLTFHNSFLEMHFRFGIGSFLIVFIIISSFFYNNLKRPHLSVLIFTILLRGLTDTIFFPGNLDFIFLLLIGTSFLKKREGKQN